jgi:hypothetical protein
MDICKFYAVTAAPCLTPAGLRWLTVRDQIKEFKDEAIRRPTDGVDASFLIPVQTGMGAQMGGICQRIRWRARLPAAERPGTHNIFYLLASRFKGSSL